MNESFSSSTSSTGPPPSEAPFFRWLKQLGWDRTDPRWIGGVCSGVAHRTGWDVSLIRGLVVVTSIFFWFPVLLYGLAWLLLPDSRTRQILLEELSQGRFTSTQVGAGLMILFGLLNPVPYYILVGAPWYWLVGLAGTATVAFVLLRTGTGRPPMSQRSSSPPQAPHFFTTPTTPQAKPQGGTPMSYPPYPPQGGTPPPGTPYPGQGRHPAGPFQSARSGTPPGYPGGPTPQGAPYPPAGKPGPYRPVTPVPALSPRIGLLVLGGLFILGAVFVTGGWISSSAGSNGSHYYFLMALAAAISLAVMAATLGFAAVRGLRGGWFLGVTIAAALFLFPSGLAASAAYQNDWALAHPGNHNGIQTRATYGPCEDGLCEVENRAADFDHTAGVINADNAQVTLDLTRASESMTEEIVLNMDDSEGVILVRHDQALQLSVNGANSQFTKLSSADNGDWFPSALSGDFQKTGANSLFTSNTRTEPAVTFRLNVNLDSSAVQLRVIDPQSEAMPFSQRREHVLPQSGSGATEPATTDSSQSSGQGETR